MCIFMNVHFKILLLNILQYIKNKSTFLDKHIFLYKDAAASKFFKNVHNVFLTLILLN